MTRWLNHWRAIPARVTRCRNHWRALPARNRRGAAVALAVVIATLALLTFQIRSLVAYYRGDDPPPSPPDPPAARAWGKTEPMLAEADRRAALALDKRLASIHAFLDERKAGSRAFAERLLGLRGKLELVKS